MAENLLEYTYELEPLGWEIAWKSTYIRHNLGRGEILDKNPYRELIAWLIFCLNLDIAIQEKLVDEIGLAPQIIIEPIKRTLDDLQMLGAYKETAPGVYDPVVGEGLVVDSFKLGSMIYNNNERKFV